MPMRKSFLLTAALFVLSLFFASRSECSSADPYIEDLMLKQGEEYVLVSAHLVMEFDDEMRQAIRGGVPLKFRYRTRLTRKGSILGERIVRNRELVHGLEYDTVRQLYLFTAEGYGSERLERTTRDEGEALRWLTTIDEYRLYPLGKLERSKVYRVRIMATLRSVELPSVLGYLFFFTTIFNRETPWVQIEFTY